MRNVAAWAFAAACSIGAIVACASNADTMGVPIGGAFDAGLGATSDNGGEQCVPAPAHAPEDPSKYPACCTDGALTGAAHCVPTSELSAVEISALAPCPGGACVPDPLITSGGAKPPSCASLNGADGVCLSVCVPQVSQYASLLPQATCASDERCAPCINPLTNAPSGACLIGEVCTGDGGAIGATGDAAVACPYTGAKPIIDPTTLPSCDPNGGAHCLGKSLVPASMASQLAACAAEAGADSLCVPDVFIASGGNTIPKTCSSLDGAEGRCLEEQIPQVAAQPQLPVDTCAKYERCVPCYSPLDGSDTGACRLSCDPGPTKPKVLFQDCCAENGTNEGKCVPSSMVPSSEASDLQKDVCTNATDLCVPKENLATPFKPPACTAPSILYLGSYTGVCLSDCLKFTGVNGLVIQQGNCDAIHQCVPCKTPLGAATGAPGCP